MTSSVREFIERAAQLVGTEAKLAAACGVSQNAIWQAKSSMLADIIQRKDGQYQIRLCDDADGLFPSRSFAKDVAATEAHLPRWGRQ
jgi:hypothetical protein